MTGQFVLADNKFYTGLFGFTEVEKQKGKNSKFRCYSVNLQIKIYSSVNIIIRKEVQEASIFDSIIFLKKLIPIIQIGIEQRSW